MRPTHLEEALLVLIHLRKQRLKFKEMEIVAISGLRKENSDSLQGALDSYRKLLFPATVSRIPKETFEETAKKQLAAEVKKAYLFKPVGEKSLDEIARKGTGQAKAIAAKYLKEKPKTIKKAVFSRRGKK